MYSALLQLKTSHVQKHNGINEFVSVAQRESVIN